MGEAAFPHATGKAHSDRRLVWLASFPKSGNTWTRILIGNFLMEPQAGEDDIPEDRISPIGSISSNRPNFDDACGLPSSDLTPEEIDLLRPAAYRHMARESRRAALFIKTHDAFQHNSAGIEIFPPDSSRGAILIVRHPMDVAYSYAHHLGHSDSTRAVHSLGDPRHTMSGDGKRQFHQLTMGWSGHYLSWTRQDVIPLLVIRYEDLLADTAAGLVRMLEFLGIEGAQDRERIDRAVALSRFDRLQAIERESGFAEIPVKAERFFRSGRSGEGAEQLPEHLQQRILAEHSAVMAELGYLG